MSGRLTSDKVTQDRLNVRSYIDTARTHGINVTTALYRPVTGNPWRPAHPTPT
jgi:transposase